MPSFRGFHFATARFFGNAVVADEYQKTIQMFKEAKDSARFFDTAYGYAVFPTVGKAGFVVGGGYGKGRVYVHGRHVGDATVVDLSVGFQLGAQAFSEILFFEDERAFREFTSGSFEIGADVGVVVITASAQVQVTTAGTSSTVAGGMNNARTSGTKYNKGLAVFVIPKGGADVPADPQRTEVRLQAVSPVRVEGTLLSISREHFPPDPAGRTRHGLRMSNFYGAAKG